MNLEIFETLMVNQNESFILLRPEPIKNCFNLNHTKAFSRSGDPWKDALTIPMRNFDVRSNDFAFE